MKETMFWGLAGLLFLGVLAIAVFYDPQLPQALPAAREKSVEAEARAGGMREVAEEIGALHEEQGEGVAMHPCRWEETCVALRGRTARLTCEGRWACPVPGDPSWTRGPLADRAAVRVH